MNRFLLAAGLVLAIALTVYLGRGVDSGAVAAPADAAACQSSTNDAALVSPDLPVRAAVSSEAAPATVAADPVDAAPGDVQDALVAPGGAVIAGLALDPLDAPLVATEIWLVAQTEGEQPVFGPWVGPEESRSATTDADGRFEYADVAPGTWWVGPAMVDDAASVVGTGVMLPLAETVVIAPDQQRAEVLLRCQAGLWTQGRVVDPDGSPVTEVLIMAWSPTTHLSASAYAGADGCFSVGPFSPGACQLEAHASGRAAGFAPSAVVDALAGATGVEIRLIRGGSLSGKIVDRVTGQVLAASVTLIQGGQRELGRSWFTLADPDASPEDTFVFGGIPPGDYDLVATVDGELIGVLSAVEVAAGAQVEGLRVEVARGGVVRVRAGAKHAAHLVRVTSGGTLLGMLESASDVGTWRLVPEGAALVELLGPDGALLAQRQVEVRAGEAQDVEFE